jgi:PadR family transcriptional regulator AphA
MRPINATAYAILGLIAAKEGSAYELVQRMKSNYRFFWPRAQSNFYASLKLLVSAGFAIATDEGKGGRPRTVYRVTSGGIEALSEWLPSAAKPPSFEFEGLLRVAYADFGDKSALLKQLEDVRENAEDALAVGTAIASAYAAGKVDLPERAHTGHLLWQFLWSQHEAMADWARWAIKEVEAWPDTRSNAITDAQARRFFSRAVAGSPDPKGKRKPRGRRG